MAPGPGLNMLGCLSEPASSSGGSKYVCNGDVCVLSHRRNPAKKEKPNPWFSFGCRSSKACATSIQLAPSHPSPRSNFILFYILGLSNCPSKSCFTSSLKLSSRLS
uniref:Uncharacterized protein n=1 Tax=Opuntia streptacantha TaxID=393608 RepID=A0A7C8YTK3_OPUST